MRVIDNDKLSIEGKGLRYKLLIIETLVFGLPFLLLLYVFYGNNVLFDVSQTLIFVFTLILILVGLIILRQIFDRFYSVATLMKVAQGGEVVKADLQKDRDELQDITSSFNTLVNKFERAGAELKRSVFDLLQIKELIEKAAKSLDIEVLLDLLLEKSMAVANANVGSVYIVEKEKGRFRVVASRRLGPALKKNTYLDIKGSIASYVLTHGKPLLVQDIETDSRIARQNDPKYGAPSFLIMPVFVREHLTATLNLSGKDQDRVFDTNDERVVSIMIGEIGFALENAQLHLRVEEHLRSLEDRTTELTRINDQLQQEIKERKRAEAALKRTYRFLKNILDSSSSISIISTDLKENILFWNKGAANIFGYSAEEVVGKKKISILYSDDVTQTEIKGVREMIMKEKKGINTKVREVTKEGRRLWINLNLTPRLDEEGRVIGILGIGEDITQRKHLEHALRDAQKMEAIGTLAGGIAHDFNNILMGILGNTTLMLLKMDSEHPHYEKLRNIQRYVQSGADLTRQLLGFSRSGKYEVKPSDINEILRKSSEMFGYTKKEINIHHKYVEGVWPVEVDRGQIEQVLLNFYVNAWQAMPAGGDLYLETENTTLEDEFVKPFGARAGRYVKVSVTDTGVGMDDATKQRIFDPFFSSKEMGRGTGLGLACAYGIIRNHGGIIDFFSEKGEGTTFNVYLPATEKRIAPEPPKLPEKALNGTETLLLVDDEDMIVDVGKMLEEVGYKVLIARSGREAIERYKENREDVSLVILDMIMPQMGGGETYDRIKDMDPGVKVLLSSGYSVDGEAAGILNRGCDGFIQKPFDIIQVSRKIRGILDKPAPAHTLN